MTAIFSTEMALQQGFVLDAVIATDTSPLTGAQLAHDELKDDLAMQVKGAMICNIQQKQLMDPYIGSFAVIVSICVKGYNEIKAESPNAAYQPRQLLKDKDPIHRVEKNAQSICNIAKDSQDEHSD